jgi:hypothetical protein
MKFLVPTGKTVSCANYCDFYADYVELCEDFAQNFGDKSWMLHHDNVPSQTSSFTKGVLRKTHDCRPPPTLLASLGLLRLPLFPQLKIKFKVCHFQTIEVIETESQAVPNIFTERDFQDAFKTVRRAGSDAYERKCASRVMMARKSKVSFYQLAVAVPEIMDERGT